MVVALGVAEGQERRKVPLQIGPRQLLVLNGNSPLPVAAVKGLDLRNLTGGGKGAGYSPHLYKELSVLKARQQLVAQ